MALAPSAFLKTALRADAVACGVFSAGVLALLLGPEALRRELGAWPPLLIAIGLVALTGVWLFPVMARRKRVSPARIGAVIAANGAWAIGCLAALALGWIDASPAGAAVVAAQALGTGLLAVLEWIGLRRSPAAAPAGKA